MIRIKLSKRNTNKHTEKGMQLLGSSIEEVGVIESISVTKQGTIISGHARKEKFDEKGLVPKEITLAENEYLVIVRNDIEDDTDTYYKAQILANTTAHQNYNLDLEEVEAVAEEYGIELEELGIEIEEDECTYNETEVSVSKDKELDVHRELSKDFLVPPFSVLDTRQGYWVERKRYWKDIIGDYGTARENNGKGGANAKSFNQERYGKSFIENGVSLLDGCLAEIVVKWFGFPKCKTFDCFAGDTVFGFVSSYLGNQFIGIELREEQANFNNERTKGMTAKYICDDGRNILNHIEEKSQDLLFSCPPYFNLEIYSDLENDASNLKEYSDFIAILNTAFSNAIKCLKDDRFACITVGDVRDKRGYYYDFIGDIKKIFIRNGMNLYNELILVQPIGSAVLRARNNMRNRKVVKTHENVLVFYKGNPNNIQKNFPIIEVREDYESDDV